MRDDKVQRRMIAAAALITAFAGIASRLQRPELTETQLFVEYRAIWLGIVFLWALIIMRARMGE